MWDSTWPATPLRYSMTLMKPFSNSSSLPGTTSYCIPTVVSIATLLVSSPGPLFTRPARCPRSGDAPDEVGGEGGGGEVHQGVGVFGAEGEEFEEGEGDEAVADAVGDGEGEGDDEEDDEGGDGGVEVVEVDFGEL